MQERILKILGVLSQSLQEEKDLFYDAEEIWQDLTRQGFSDRDIEGALSHIERTSLEIPGPYWSDDFPIYRVFTGEETSRITKAARGYLWTLKCRGIIDHAIEDEIVQKALNLEDIAGVREIKTVAALTVFGYEHRTQELRVKSHHHSHLI